jgi:hypothetical protein
VIPALARQPVMRLIRRPSVWIAVGAWCILACTVGLAAHARGSPHGADHALIDTYGALALPLLAYALVGAIVASQSLRSSMAPLVAFGAPPAQAAAVAIGVAAMACAGVGALTAAAVAVLAHGVADPPVLRDAGASAYAGALGGAAYAAWFSFGSAFGRQGGGRAVLLLVDWILGATGGTGALVTPRGHLRNLLGGAPPMDLSQRASAAALVVLALAFAAIAIRRVRT